MYHIYYIYVFIIYIKTPGSSDGQGGLGCCCSWGHQYSDTTEQLK